MGRERVGIRVQSCLIERKAKNKGLPFNLSTTYLTWLLATQGYRCAITGLRFHKGPTGPYTMTLDRIEPDLGYVQGNVRFVLMGVNGLKHAGTDEDMYDIAKAVVAALEGVYDD